MKQGKSGFPFYFLRPEEMFVEERKGKKKEPTFPRPDPQP